MVQLSWLYSSYRRTIFVMILRLKMQMSIKTLSVEFFLKCFDGWLFSGYLSVENERFLGCRIIFRQRYQGTIFRMSVRLEE